MDNDKPWRDDPIIISEQTLNNVVVVSNPNPYQVIVSTAGGTELRIDTRQSIPRKLVPRRLHKTNRGSLALAGYQQKSGGEKSREVRENSISRLPVRQALQRCSHCWHHIINTNSPTSPSPTENIREPRDNLGGQNHPGKSLWVMFPRTSISFFRA